MVITNFNLNDFDMTLKIGEFYKNMYKVPSKLLYRKKHSLALAFSR